MKKYLLIVLGLVCLSISGAAFSDMVYKEQLLNNSIPQIPINPDWGIDGGDSVQGYD